MSNGPNFEKVPLLPAVIQDLHTREVLMLGYLSREAWDLTQREGKMHYFSRKKKRIWLKGEQSGHYQHVKEIRLNCDGTALLVLVEQVGGACDLGYRACFESVLRNGIFEFAPESERVFEPAMVYGGNFTETLVLGVPSGSLERMTFRLFELAGFEIDRPTDRCYQPRIANESGLEILMARAEELPHFAEDGVIDAALTGFDLVADSKVSVEDVCDLGYNKCGIGPVCLALAVPESEAHFNVRELEGKRIATAYPTVVQAFFERLNIKVKVIRSLGVTEGKVPRVAAAVVDLVETGTTLRANGLVPVLKVMDTTVHLFAANSSWGYTWKRRALEQLATRLLQAASSLPPNPKLIIPLPGDSEAICKTQKVYTGALAPREAFYERNTTT